MRMELKMLTPGGGDLVVIRSPQTLFVAVDDQFIKIEICKYMQAPANQKPCTLLVKVR